MRRIEWVSLILLTSALSSCVSPMGEGPSLTPASMPDQRISFWASLNDGSNQMIQYSIRFDGTDLREDGRGQSPEEPVGRLAAPNGNWIAEISESRLTVLSTGENPYSDMRELHMMASIRSVDWSPTSRYLSFSSRRIGDSETHTVFVYNMETRDLLQIGDADGLDNFWQTWSSIGDRLAYVAGDARHGCAVGSVVVVLDMPSGSHERAVPEVEMACTPAWSPVDDRLALAAKLSTDADLEIYVVFGEESTPRNVSQLPSEDCCASFSPDGQYVAFLALGAGSLKIYVGDLASNRVWRLSTLGDDVSENRFEWVR